jgi:hypothetical protein
MFVIDENKETKKYPIESIDDLFSYKEVLISACLRRINK